MSKQNLDDLQRFVKETTEQLIESRLGRLELKVDMLIGLLTSPKNPPNLIDEAGLKPKFMMLPSEETAARARVGMAAKVRGLTFKEWVDRYGVVEPDDLTEEQKATLPPRLRTKRIRRERNNGDGG